MSAYVKKIDTANSVIVKIFQVSANKEMGKQTKLVKFSPQNLFHLCLCDKRAHSKAYWSHNCVYKL